MSTLRRLPMLARLARRYARRHRGQTLRAVLGLLVVSLVLTTGMGLGDSMGSSLETSITERYGPVELIVRGPPSFNATVVEGLPAGAAAAPFGLTGAATLVVTGSVSNPARERAEAFASLRGVGPDEPVHLGQLPGGVAEPGPGEAVLSQALADRIAAQVGDRLVLRALPPDLNQTFGLQSVPANGTLAPGASLTVPVEVRPDALGILVTVRFGEGVVDGSAGSSDAWRPTGNLRSPLGQQHPGQPTASGLEVRVLAPVTAGEWNLSVDLPAGAPAPIDVDVLVRIAYTPPQIEDLVTVLNVTVTGIVPAQGRAGVTTRPMAMLHLASMQEALGLGGKASHGYFAVDGDAQAAADALELQLGNRTWDVDATKQDAIERVRRDAGNITGFILVMGGFTLVASMLLAYVLFSSLVEERRVELGVARALGLTRREVAISMVLEALIYAVLAAAVGLLLGLALVWGLLELINGYAAQFRAPRFELALAPMTVPLAFLGGVLLPVGTILAGSVRFARLDPARAIRGAPDDVRASRWLAKAAGAALALGGLLLCLDPLWILVGPGMAAAGLATMLLAARRRAWAALPAAAGVLYTVWTLYSFDRFPMTQREMDPVLTMLRALLVTLLLATIAMSSPRPFAALGRAFARIPPLRRPAYVALRYLGSRRVQAALTAAMVAVVAVIVAVMGTLAAIFAGTLLRDEGGYDVVGQSPFPLTTFPTPLPPADAAAVAEAQFLPVHQPLGDPRMTLDGKPFREGRFVRFAGISPSFAAANGYAVEERDPRYATDRDAWEAVAEGEAVLAPSFYFGPEGLRSGATLEVSTGRGTQSYVVAGMVPDARRADIYLAFDAVRGMGFPQTSTVLVRAAPDADATRLAHRLTEAYQEQGLVFESVEEEVREATDILRATVLVLQSFLFLGLFVGISSTGFLASRAVHERMRDIGTLRAMGYEPRDVPRAFVLESVLVSAFGLLIGLAVGLTVAHSIWWRSVRAFGGDFVLPWDVLLAFSVAVLGLTALASWRPTRRAARLDPAVALRHVE